MSIKANCLEENFRVVEKQPASAKDNEKKDKHTDNQVEEKVLKRDKLAHALGVEKGDGLVNEPTIV